MVSQLYSVFNGWEQIVLSSLDTTKSILYRFEYRRKNPHFTAVISFDEQERDKRVRVTARVSHVQDGQHTEMFSIEETLVGDDCKYRAAQQVEHRAKLLNAWYFLQQ